MPPRKRRPQLPGRPAAVAPETAGTTDMLPYGSDLGQGDGAGADERHEETRPLVTPPPRRKRRQPRLPALVSDNEAESEDDATSDDTGGLAAAATMDGLSPASSADAEDAITTPLRDPSEAQNAGEDGGTAGDAAAAANEMIMSVLDHLEDDWDEVTYLDLVPLQVRLSLEETLFGWDHLWSSFVGHAFYCLAAAAACFAALLWLLPTWATARQLASAAAGFAALRMVRRRRRVWMRHAYGSSAYRRDNMRRLRDVREADTGWLGRLRRQRRQRRSTKQLQSAAQQFQRHHARQLRRAETAPAACEGEGSDSNCSSCALSPLPPYHRQKVRRCFRTDPAAVTESIRQDQIVFAHGPIRRMPYSHGGYFAAAPFLLANPHWISVLRHLMPDVYVEMSRRVGRAPMQKLIHWAENNPVVAAYGSAQELEYDGRISNFEWDVFLDPILVRKLAVVLEKRAKFLDSIGVVVTRPMDRIRLPSIISDQNKGILKYYNKQLLKRSQDLVDKMLIAHGNLTQLIIEQTGYLKRYNYSRVKRTRRTLGGGIYAQQWMAVYAESLRIGLTEDDWRNIGSESPERDYHLMTLGPLDPEYTAMDTTIEEAVAVVENIAKCKEPIGLVLDLKSRHVPKLVWACVVDTLRKAGVRVEGIGSFVSDDIRGVSSYSIKPVTEVLFFHSAGDFQAACHAGDVQMGDTVFFNAGSLLWNPASSSFFEAMYNAFVTHFDPEQATRSYQLLPFAQPCARSSDNSATSTIEHYKIHYNLSIGMYVQEFAIDEAAVSLLAEHVNRNPHIFDLGLAWGGINGLCIRGIRPDRWTNTDGFWNQRFLGTLWNPHLFPPGYANGDLSLLLKSSDSDTDDNDSWNMDESSLFLDTSPRKFYVAKT